MINRLIGGDGLQWHVPGAGVDFFYTLKVVRQTDEVWFSPERAVAQVGETLVVEAAAHAKAVAVCVESHERHENEIQRLCSHPCSCRHDRFKNAEAVRGERGILREWREPQAIVPQA